MAGAGTTFARASLCAAVIPIITPASFPPLLLDPPTPAVHEPSPPSPPPPAGGSSSQPGTITKANETLAIERKYLAYCIRKFVHDVLAAGKMRFLPFTKAQAAFHQADRTAAHR